MNKFRHRASFVGMIVLSVAILVVLNLVSQRVFCRWDLTRNHEFSLSPSTRKILRKLEDVLIVDIILSPNLPSSYYNISVALHDLMDEFRSYGGGEVNVEFLSADSPKARQLIEQMKLQPFVVGEASAQQEQRSLIYSYIVLSYQDKSDVVPAIPTNISQMEYELASRLVKFTHREKKKVGLVTGLGEPPPYDPSSQLLQSLVKQNYALELVPLKEKREIPADITTLLIVNPRHTTALDRFKIDQFILKGRNVFFLVDGVDVQPGANEGYPVEHQLNSLLSAYGVTLKNDLVLDYRRNLPVQIMQNINLGGMQGQMMSPPIPYPFYVIVAADNFNRNLPFFGDLQGVFIPFVGSVEVAATHPGIDIQPLLTSTPFSKDVTGYFDTNVNQFTNGYPSVEDMAHGHEKGDYKAYTLGVYLQGRFPSAFKGKPIPSPVAQTRKEGEESSSPREVAPAERLETAVGESRLIVIGSSAWIRKQYLQEGGQSNLILFLNMLDALTMGKDLIDIRSKGDLFPLITLKPDVSPTLYLLGNTFFVPVLLIILGIVWYLYRNARKTIPYA